MSRTQRDRPIGEERFALTSPSLNLNLLVHLEALLREGHVSQAAKCVSVTQSAMSAALSKLRLHYNDELLQPHGKIMVLTPFGRSLIPVVQDAMRLVRKVAVFSGEKDPATIARTLIISGSDFSLDILLDKVTPGLEKQAPGVRIKCLPNTPRSEEGFLKGAVDIRVVPAHLRLPAYPAQPLFENEYACVVWKDNSLVTDEVSLNEFAEMGHVRVVLGLGRLPTYEPWLQSIFGLVRRIEIEVNSFRTAMRIVKGTQRALICQKMYFELYGEECELRQVLLPFAIPPSTVLMQWNADARRDPFLAWFVDYVRSCFGGAAGMASAPEGSCKPSVGRGTSPKRSR